MSFLLLGVFSLVVAALVFLLTDGVDATVDGEWRGISFSASGALAGFITILWLSIRGVERLRAGHAPARVTLRVPVNENIPLSENPSSFDRRQQYTCSYELYDEETGDSRESATDYVWDGGHLTVFVRGVGENDIIMVRVEDGQKAWESEHLAWQTVETIVRPA